MAAKDNLGGQFGASKPQQIPAHHRDAILKAINTMGERGMELVPGGMHVTPSDGGKSHFIPHADAQLHVSTSKPDDFNLELKAPSEGEGVATSVIGNRYLGPTVHTGVGPLLRFHDGEVDSLGPSTFHATSMREAHDDPAHLHDRTHDSVLPDWSNAQVSTTGDSPRFYYNPSEGTSSLNSYETLNRLPHLGGNPKDPAQSFTINLGQKSRMGSDDIDALKGLHRSYSHVYDEGDQPAVIPRPALRRGPVRARDRHVFPVFLADDENPENSTAYMYNTTNGQITKNFFED